jgi:hypothetical protein
MKKKFIKPLTFSLAFGCCVTAYSTSLWATKPSSRALPGHAYAHNGITAEEHANLHDHMIQHAVPKQDMGEKKVQIALLLDTSSSMSGLINQAREHLWSVVNTFAECQHGKKAPILEVALYEYGNSRLSSQSGYIKKVCDFTRDLDFLSQSLFALSTNGGDEYCGQVIASALDQLEWNFNEKSYRSIFIAGNEPFTQGSVPWNESCRHANEKSIHVNTIFCGSLQEGVQTGWKDGALMASGTYLNIDQNAVAVYKAAPQDVALSKLNGQLNDTYVPYGAQGGQRRKMQVEQDAQAEKSSISSFFSRTMAKSSSLYENASWDLVDAVEQNKVEVNEELKSHLSPELQKLEAEELTQYIAKKAKERQDIQGQIQQLQVERSQWLAKNAEQKDGADLGSAMIKAIKEQTTAKEINFK